MCFGIKVFAVIETASGRVLWVEEHPHEFYVFHLNCTRASDQCHSLHLLVVLMFWVSYLDSKDQHVYMILSVLLINNTFINEALFI